MKDNKIFYLHIPKTAGTTMTSFLKSQYEKNDILPNIETRKIDSKIIKFDKYKVLTGHIPLPKMINYFDVFRTRKTIAIFRTPLDQVVSHLNHIRYLGERSQKLRLLRQNKNIQQIVRKMLEVNLSDSQELNKFIDWLEQTKLFLFHNIQTKYLCGGSGESYSAVHINKALVNLEKIDFIGTTERLNEFLMLLTYEFDWTYDSMLKVENQSKMSYGIDVNNPEIKKVLFRLIEWDQIIYRIAREKFIDRMHLFLSDLEKSSNPKFSTVREQKILNRLK